MDIKKLSNALLVAGLILFVASIIWWANSYSEAFKLNNGAMAVRCLWGSCLDEVSYTPVIFIVSVLLFVAGAILAAVGNPEPNSRTKSETSGR